MVNLPGMVEIKVEWWLGPTTPDQCGQNPACIIARLLIKLKYEQSDAILSRIAQLLIIGNDKLQHIHCTFIALSDLTCY